MGQRSTFEIADLSLEPGELSFEASYDGHSQRVWMRADVDSTPPADAALAACLMPAMASGAGLLSLMGSVSPRFLRNQREFQAIQRSWSRGWEFAGSPLAEVEVRAPTRRPSARAGSGRVAAFFSGGVDSWATLQENPEITDLIFVRGFDLRPGVRDQEELAGEVEARLREAAEALGLPLHLVSTNLRELSDPLLGWETVFGSALAAVALFFEPLFERVLIASDQDHEVQPAEGTARMVDHLFSTERQEIVDAGGRHNREERIRRIVANPLVQRTLRVCWENPNGAYNCGRCRKCLATMLSLEAIGAREAIGTFPAELDLGEIASVEISRPILLSFWEDLLDTVRAAGRVDLERPIEAAVAKGKRTLGLPLSYRRRKTPGPAPTIRIAAIVAAWGQSQQLAATVRSALEQQSSVGVGVVIVNDGCLEARTDQIGQALRDADPERVVYVRQPNRGVSSARNAGIRRALARWPHLEAVFPLDVDNLLSPHTLAELWAVLEESGEVDWASPVLEFFGAEDGEWFVPPPCLPYRQLFSNQCDAGSLIRRRVFEAGIEFATEMNGFEDWEFFLHATLAGFRGRNALRSGFRYRRRPDSQLASAWLRTKELEAALRRLHPDAYQARALTLREHAEVPRFALVRTDRDDVLLSAACDLEPRRLELEAFTALIRATAGGQWPATDQQVPPITVFAASATLRWLDAGHLLAGALLRMQLELKRRRCVGVRITPAAGLAGFSALALRTGELSRLKSGAEAVPEWVLEVAAPEQTAAPALGSLPPELFGGLADPDATARFAQSVMPAAPHSRFFEHLHIDKLETTLPWCGEEGAPRLLVVAPRASLEGVAGRRCLASVRDLGDAQPRLSIHLALTDPLPIEAGSEACPLAFDTMTALGGGDQEATARLLERLAASSDFVLEAGSPTRRELDQSGPTDKVVAF